MTAISPSASLGDLVSDAPSRAALFERLGFDFCCGGARSLAEACAERGLDVETVVAVLAAQAAVPDAGTERDWRRAPAAELCDHIVEAHHERLRRELPRVAEVLDKVVRVHGGDEPALHELRALFAGLRAELAAHMEREEQVLFPACRALDAGEAPAIGERELLAELEDEHAEVGGALRAMRDAAGGYRADAARCGSHRALLEGLRELERDLHQHIHEENNVLFPRVRARLTA